ncbi:MAG: photosynthetic complex putative assembly protein PuhB [Pseudomonadales bacterium]
MSGHDDFEREPEPGLPERLPPGETVLWRGAPDWRSLARRAFHVRKVGAYFALLALWFVLEALHDGAPLGEIGMTLVRLTSVAAVAIGLLALMAWLSARESVYTLTNQRVVVRFGVALRLTLNVPFKIIEGAELRRYANGTGDIALSLGGSDRVSYAVLWPHARPWRLRHPQIMLRCVADAEQVADRLGAALARHAPAAQESEAPTPATQRPVAGRYRGEAVLS